jgi:hypothetical protein
MWRAFFTAVGISLCILGAECLLLEKANLNLPAQKEPEQTSSYLQIPPYLQPASAPPNSRELQLPDWAPWTLLSAGTVIVLYSMTVAKS